MYIHNIQCMYKCTIHMLLLMDIVGTNTYVVHFMYIHIRTYTCNMYVHVCITCWEGCYCIWNRWCELFWHWRMFHSGIWSTSSPDDSVYRWGLLSPLTLKISKNYTHLVNTGNLGCTHEYACTYSILSNSKKFASGVTIIVLLSSHFSF